MALSNARSQMRLIRILIVLCSLRLMFIVEIASKHMPLVTVDKIEAVFNGVTI